jgi:hypothetical protein
MFRREEKDPDGGPFPAYPSGKTWEEPSGKTGSGKKFFHNIIDTWQRRKILQLVALRHNLHTRMP